MSPLALRLRELRERQGLTQQALADKAGVRRETIADHERRLHVGITFEHLEKLAGALGVEPGELIGTTTNPRRHR